MSNTFYDFLIVLSAIVIGFLAFVNELPDGKISVIIKKPVIKLLIIIIFVAIGYAGSKGKELNAEAESKRTNDSNNKKNDDNYKSLAIQLAKYGFDIKNEKNQLIAVVRDSARKVTNITITKGEEPELDIVDIVVNKKKADSLALGIQIISKKAKATNIFMRQYVCINDASNSYIYLKENDSKGEIDNLTLGSNVTFEYGMHLGGLWANQETYYFLFLGSYRDSNNKLFQFKRLCSVNTKNKTIGYPFSPTDNSLYAFYRSQGIKFK